MGKQETVPAWEKVQWDTITNKHLKPGVLFESSENKTTEGKRLIFTHQLVNTADAVVLAEYDKIKNNLEGMHLEGICDGYIKEHHTWLENQHPNGIPVDIYHKFTAEQEILVAALSSANMGNCMFLRKAYVCMRSLVIVCETTNIHGLSESLKSWIRVETNWRNDRMAAAPIKKILV
jgi:hypothetical protein